MKVGLIPPIAHLDQFGKGEFHLLLSHLLTDRRYVKHYQEQRRKGAYIVLDNSAHENKKGENAKILREQACDINAQEVVVPDVLFSSFGTVRAAVSALECWYEKKDTSMLRLNPTLMYVPQGTERGDWVSCMDELIMLHTYMSKKHNIRRDFTLGISKDYETWNGGLLRLIDESILPRRMQIAKTGSKMHVHLLGWGRDLWKLGEIAKKHSWIRSTDSAKPFVYALHNTYLEPENEYPYPGRPADYFIAEFASRPALHRAQHNCGVFTSYANGETFV
jgi:hypothetical protein